jgi:hypothetical protein
MEITSALSSSAHCRPRKIISDVPPPSSSSTLPTRAAVTPGATPIRTPSTSRPKIVPEQWVPCPFGSPFPLRRVVPVSSTATVAPSPENGKASAPTAATPQASAAGAVEGKGRISSVGMIGAMEATSGSRASSRTSRGSRSSTSRFGSGGVRVAARVASR